MSSSCHKSVSRRERVQQTKKGLQQENQLYFARSYADAKSSEPPGRTNVAESPMGRSLSKQLIEGAR
jgi:hypothetical protein